MDKEADNFGLLKITIDLRHSPKNPRRATYNLGTGSQCHILFVGLDYIKIHPCTGTEALYRPYDPYGE
jgi:hypothetical protein